MWGRPAGWVPPGHALRAFHPPHHTPSPALCPPAAGLPHAGACWQPGSHDQGPWPTGARCRGPAQVPWLRGCGPGSCSQPLGTPGRWLPLHRPPPTPAWPLQDHPDVPECFSDRLWLKMNTYGYHDVASRQMTSKGEASSLPYFQAADGRKSTLSYSSPLSDFFLLA